MLRTLFEVMREHGHAIGFVNKTTSGYAPCPQHSGSELIEVETPEDGRAVLCYEAWSTTECDFVSARKEQDAE